MMKEPIKQYKPVEKLELPIINKDLPEKYKQITCPACMEVVNADHLDLPNKVAKCGSCQVVFSIAEELSGLHVKSAVKQEIFRPEGIDLFYYKNDLEISMRQNIHPVDYVGLMIFGLIAVFAVGYTAIGIFNIPVSGQLFSVAGLLFFLYRSFLYRKARTHIDISETSLTVKHRPNNFKKDLRFPAEDIDQLYLKKCKRHSGYFAIHAIINKSGGQQHQRLLSASTLSKAKYIEQEIEKYLGIENRKVPEELA